MGPRRFSRGHGWMCNGAEGGGVVVLLGLTAAPCAAQSVTGEVDVTGGVSTENVRAGSTQGRIFGASASDWRFFAEATWAGVDGQHSDAFGAAYPYEGRIRPMEVFGEKMFRPGNYLLGVRAGRYRTPFGISSRGEYGYTGFVRAPLIRYGQDFALSNTWLEHGVDIVAGSPRLFLESSLGVPGDEGGLRRRRGLDRSIRVQGYYKALIVGASRLYTRPRPGARRFRPRGIALQRRRRALHDRRRPAPWRMDFRTAVRRGDDDRRISRSSRPPPRPRHRDPGRQDRTSRLRGRSVLLPLPSPRDRRARGLTCQVASPGRSTSSISLRDSPRDAGT